ncbi:hypothetical protein [Parvularcula maris]|uniref:Uncharacterized protein n=1 Tax=Parvularcula maris TaxID=2965077 RepID=A0A9X2L9T6_9PROT|nr:hypothetical protein [Parvularcula maris]MCQ8185765.1 hypothetical protein [Parvularcula maris]
MDLIARVIAIFETPTGMAVLGMAVVAFLALFVLVFWDSLHMPRRDRVEERSFDAAPPPLLDPKLITRSEEGGFRETRPRWVRAGVLAGLGLLFLVFGSNVADQLGSDAARASFSSPRPQPVQEAKAAETAALPAAPGGHVDLCSPEGSLADGGVRVCADGASVGFDLLRLSVGGQFVLRPVWASDKAPTFITSDSHAAPFTLADGVAFAVPETAPAQRYDGYLVIGVGADEVSLKREDALRRFAVAKLSGGNRSHCDTSERVYSATAHFDAANAAALAELKKSVEALRKKARRNAKAKAELDQAERQLASAMLLVTEAPAPIIIGIEADPLSTDLQADMLAASRVFLEEHADILQIDTPSPVRALSACTRGAAAF